MMIMKKWRKEKQKKTWNYKIRKATEQLEKKKIISSWKYWKRMPSQKQGGKSRKGIREKNQTQQ